MRGRFLRVPVIVDAIAHITFLTLHGPVGVTSQTEFRRTSTELDAFRMHTDDYAIS